MKDPDPYSFHLISAFCDVSYILQLHMTQDDYSFLSCSVQEWGPFQKCTQKRKQAFPLMLHLHVLCDFSALEPETSARVRG